LVLSTVIFTFVLKSIEFMKKYYFLFLFWVFSTCAFAQNVTITPSGISPAMSGTYPRLAFDAILALPSPVVGDIAYDITFLCLRVFNGSKWVCTYQSPTDPNPNLTAIATGGGTSDDFVRQVAVDASGNVYITGSFNGTATFGATSKTSVGNNDIFIAKYSSSGTLQWVQSAGSTSNDLANGIALDASGNVYITGYFYGTATFGAISKTSAGNADIFVAKYSSSGTLQWVQSAGGTSNDAATGIAVDASGNVYITGYFFVTATFGATSKTSAGGSDIFVAKYSSSGTLQWVQSAGGTSSDDANGIAIDASGNVYITGYFYGTATFGATSKTSAGNADIFVAKYDPVGTAWSWVESAGGTSTDAATGIAVDASGNVYITGYFYSTATFGVSSKTSAGSADIFIAKYSNSGTLLWVQSVGGTSIDVAFGIALDASGNVYITGYFYVTATFGATSKTSVGSADIFLAKYSNTGTLQWVQSAGGTDYDYANGIAIDASGNVYIAGNFFGTATFGAISKTSAGGSDIFVARVQE
jgi:uncharacterized protein (AIM24 family)